MAQYNSFDELLGNPMFAEFAKSNFGISDLSKVDVFDQSALLSAYRYSIHSEGHPELSADEKASADEIINGIPNEEAKNFAQNKLNKPYEELNASQKIFVAISMIERKKEAERLQQVQQEQPIAGGNDSDVKQNENNEQLLGDMKRIRSAYSDSNEQWLRWEKLNALKEMGVVEEDMPQVLDPVTTIDLLQKYEPTLSEKQTKEMTEKVTDKVLKNNELFDLLPPSVLAAMYDDLKEQTNKEKDKEKLEAITAKFDKVAGRMDELAEMAAKEKDLHFADVTNIADAYNGYNAMFVARYNDLMAEKENGETDDAKSLASEKLQNYQGCMEVAKGKIDEYDSVYNLSAVSAEKAEDLNARFEKMRETIAGVEITPEMAKLVSNFKFLDREYFTLDAEQLQTLQEKFPSKDFSAVKTYSMLNDAERGYLDEQGMLPKAEPQFIDANGNASDKWSEGAKVLPGSKLDKAILAAKQSVMLENLGTDTEITPEFLTQAVSEQLPKTLYSLHIVDQVSQGILENPDQYTKKEYLDRFIAELGNVEKPMAIGPTAYDAGLDNIVNQTGGYAERLAQRLGVDKDGKEVKNPNINVATKLFEPIESIDKNAKDRIAMKANGKQGYWKTVGKTFLSAATMSAAMRLVGTAAQSVTGLQVAAPAVGSIVGVSLTAYQIRKWNKERKAAGLGTGFKDFVKDRRMMMTVGTTALGCAATACMAFPGAQPVGIGLGLAAMAVGATNGAITAYKAARASGESKWKSILKAAGIVGASALGAFGGMKAADAAIDAYNQHNPNNEIFKHKEHVKVSDGTPETRETVIDRDALEADSRRYNEQYNISDRVHHGMSHDEYLNAVDDYNKAHPEAQITNPDELLKGAYNSQNGRVYGPGYVAEHGLDPNVVKAVGNLINSDGSINPDAVKAWQGSDLWQESGLKNFVQGVNEPVETRPDLYPSRNPESTYSGVGMPTKEIVHEGTGPVYEDRLVDNSRPLGVAMVGVMGNVVTKQKTLKERVGSLLDRLIGKKKQEEQKQDVILPKKQEEEKKQDVIPPKKQEEELRPIEVDGDDKKKYKKPTIQIMALDEGLLKMEYRCIYGTRPNKKEFEVYKAMVTAELNRAKQNGEVKTDVTMETYLKDRAEKFEEQIKQALNGKEDTPKNRGYVIREARKTMKSKFDGSNETYPTLKHLSLSVPAPKTQTPVRARDAGGKVK